MSPFSQPALQSIDASGNILHQFLELAGGPFTFPLAVAISSNTLGWNASNFATPNGVFVNLAGRTPIAVILTPTSAYIDPGYPVQMYVSGKGANAFSVSGFTINGQVVTGAMSFDYLAFG